MESAIVFDSYIDRCGDLDEATLNFNTYWKSEMDSLLNIALTINHNKI